MVELVKENNDRVLEYMRTLMDKYGKDKMAVDEVYKLADIVKDLAEAEKSCWEAEKFCWEAEYYRSVTEAMESSGYTPDMMGYQGQGGRGVRMGYNPNRDSMGRYSRRGYDGTYGYDYEPLEALRAKMGGASPEEREKMKRELRQMLDM